MNRLIDVALELEFFPPRVSLLNIKVKEIKKF